jgi:hypothetical protein
VFKLKETKATVKNKDNIRLPLVHPVMQE